MRFRIVLFSCLLAVLMACAGHAPLTIYPPYQHPGWRPLDYQAVLAKHPMKRKQAMQVISVDRTRVASFHLVRVRTQEQPHYHARHDGTAFLLEGRGTLYLKGEKITMRPGTVASIPRRAVHHFVNEADEPAIFYVIFNPPFDGKDRIRVRSVKDLLD